MCLGYMDVMYPMGSRGKTSMNNLRFKPSEANNFTVMCKDTIIREWNYAKY